MDDAGDPIGADEPDDEAEHDDRRFGCEIRGDVIGERRHRGRPNEDSYGLYVTLRPSVSPLFHWPADNTARGLRRMLIGSISAPADRLPSRTSRRSASDRGRRSL